SGELLKDGHYDIHPSHGLARARKPCTMLTDASAKIAGFDTISLQRVRGQAITRHDRVVVVVVVRVRVRETRGYRHNFVSMATRRERRRLPCSTSLLWTTPMIRLTSSRAAHSIAEPLAIPW